MKYALRSQIKLGVVAKILRNSLHMPKGSL